LSKHKNVELVTISGRVQGQAENTFKAEIQRDLISRHINIPMRRFISPARDLHYILRLYISLIREAPDAVITFATKPNIYGQLAAYLACVRFRVMAVRGLGRTFTNEENAGSGILKSMMTILYKGACHLAHKVWFTNKNDLDDFTNLGLINEEKLFLTKNAIDLNDFNNDRIEPAKLKRLRSELGFADECQIVIMVARLIKQKGVLEYAEAAIRLKKRFPNLWFLLVAPEEDDSPSAVSADEIRHTTTKSNLLWLGFRKDVRELYALSDIAVLPSYYREGGYPRALLEAMAYGKPVIAADTPECKGPVAHGKNGYLVPTRDADALAKAIEDIATNPILAQTMGAHSLNRVKTEFDDKQVFHKLIDEVIFPGIQYGST